FLRGHGVPVGSGEVDRDRARRLRTVDQKWRSPRLAQPREIESAAGRPEDVRDGDQPSAWRHRGEQRLFVCLSNDNTGAARVQRADQAEMLLIGCDDLVLRAELESGEHDLAPARRRIGEGDELRGGSQDCCDPAADSLSHLPDLLDPGRPAAALRKIALEPSPRSVDGRLRQRPVRACVEVREALQDGKLRPRLLERHSTTASTGAWSERTRPATARRSSGHAVGPSASSSPPTRIWSMLPARGGEKPSATGATRFASPATIDRSP